MALDAARRNTIHLMVVHAGGNDLTAYKTPALIEAMRDDLTDILRDERVQCIAWSDVIQRRSWRGAISHKGMRSPGERLIEPCGNSCVHTQLFREDGVHLSREGLDLFIGNIRAFIDEWWRSRAR
ncbi:hypothetical protein XENTR_v10014103 [Xenopus tropicalis]|nr:hypothetical protein XENTR_v10014103 [Xenopus tropicalis]